jgi:protein-arginine kinase activator protein McsA
MDIIFLQKRLEYLVKNEEYEIATRIKKWIDELKTKYETQYN